MGKFILNAVVAFVVYGILYTVGGMLFAEQMMPGMAKMRPEEAILVPTLAYHFVQTVVVVWLFNKAVASDDLKAGAIFGAMIGLYLLASDAIWFESLLDFPGDARPVMAIMHLVNGAIVGALLSFMHGKGLGSAAADT